METHETKPRLSNNLYDDFKYECLYTTVLVLEKLKEFENKVGIFLQLFLISFLFRAHLHRKQASEVVFPVVPSGNDDPLLHVVILDGAYGRTHVETHWRGQMVKM